MNYEAALICKVLEEKDISKVFNSKVNGCFRIYNEELEWVSKYYLKYKALPSLDILKNKFEYFDETKTDATIDYLIEEVSTDFLRYKLDELIQRAANDAEDNPREALKYIFAKASALGHQTDVVKDVDLASDYWMRLNNLKERAQVLANGQHMLGIPSGIKPIDLIFGGWQKGDFAILMGFTGKGKSWLATYFAAQAWKMGKTPLYFSLEMDDKQFGYRLDTLLGKGKFSNTSLMNAKRVDIDAYEVWMRDEFSNKQPFYIVTNEGLDEVDQFTVQSKIEQYKPDIVFLDYHSLFDDARKGRNETEKHRNLSKDFKRMAVRFGVPIVDVVAVTMEDGHSTRPPELHEVAWSKQLAYDSDLVLSLSKSGQRMTVESKKQRRSEPFAFELFWDLDAGTVSILD